MNTSLGRVTLALVVSALLVPAARAEDPVVQGKPLHYWIDMLKENDALAREEGLEVLMQAGPVAKPALPEVRGLLKDQPFTVRFRAAIALWKIGGEAKQAVPVLLDGLAEPNRGIRLRAIQTLGQLGAEAAPAAPALVEKLNDKDFPLRNEARHALEQIGTGAVPALAKGTAAGEPSRRWCVDLLGKMGPPAAAAVPALEAALKDEDVGLRTAVAAALWRIDRTNTASVPILVEGLKAADPAGKRQAADILLAMRPRPKAAADGFAALLKGTDPVLRLRAAVAVWELNGKPEEVLPALTEAVRTNDPTLRGQALETLQRMGPHAKGALPTLTEMLGTIGARTPQFQETFLAIGPDAMAAALKALEEQPVTAKQNAAQILGNFGPDAVEPLSKLAAHENVSTRAHAVLALGLIGPSARDKVVPVLTKALEDKDRTVKVNALTGFRHVGPDVEAPPALYEQLKEQTLRSYALTALERLKLDPKAALPPLEEVMTKDPSLFHRARAAELCWQLDPKKYPAADVVKQMVKDRQANRAADFLARIGADGRDALPALIEALNDPQPAARQKTCDVLAGFGADAKAARPGLTKLLKDPEPAVRVAAALALIQQGDTEAAVPVVAAVIQDFGLSFHHDRIHAALRKLGTGGKAASPVLQKAASEQSVTAARVQAALTLAKVDPDQKALAIAALNDVVGRMSSVVQFDAAAALLEIEADNRRARTVLENGLTDVNAFNRFAAARALGRLGPDARAALPALRRATEDESPQVRSAAAAAWWKVDGKNPEALALLTDAVKDRGAPTDTRLQAVTALGDLGPDAKDAAPVLLEALRDRNTSVRSAAEAALKKVDAEAARKAGY